MKRISRRALIAGGGFAAGGLVAASWSTLSKASGYRGLMEFGDRFNMHAQRLAMWTRPLVPEYRHDQITPNHPVNGGFGSSYVDPNPRYSDLVREGFRSWRLVVDGHVHRPLALSLPQIQAMPMRSQITMHSCDEGWSAIAKWSGVQLSEILALSGILPTARYVVFHCMDKIAGNNVYSSIDLLDAMHPQTLLAYRFNDQPLPVGHGAPLRLRIELQIGYKNSKHINRIEVVDSLAHLGNGKGGLFEDMGFQWYAGL